MNDYISKILERAEKELKSAPLAPLTPPQQELEPLTAPAIFLIHWAASLGIIVESRRILNAYNRENLDLSKITADVALILGSDLMPDHFAEEALPFIQKYYRTGWTHSYRRDFYDLFREIEDINEAVLIPISKHNLERIAERIDLRFKEWQQG